MTRSRPTHRAFTLVEMLVVIGIIVVLVAILVPVIAGAVRRAKIAQIAFEINTIDKAVTAYADKKGDEPPDFSEVAVVVRHLDTCYKRIDASERNFILSLASSSTSTGLIDPAEALVFWLGGLSDNERRPFTGEGGPVTWIDANSDNVVNANEISYNSDRNLGFFEFKLKRLSLKEVNVGGGTVLYQSNDESTLHLRPAASDDPFPVYSPPNRTQPYVYFDSRTYRITDSSGIPIQTYPSIRTTDYQPGTNVPTFGVARPYATTERNPNFFQSGPSNFDLRAHYFANPKGYQIISASLDADYGTDVILGSMPVLKMFATGAPYHPATATWDNAGLVIGYQEGDRDNVTNFSEGALEDKLP